MALVLDGQYRGRHACHVHPHVKLGAHRTIINDAFDLVDELLYRHEVLLVDLGKMGNAKCETFTRRCECRCYGKHLIVVLVAEKAAQKMRVELDTHKQAKELAVEIRQRWSLLPCGLAP